MCRFGGVEGPNYVCIPAAWRNEPIDGVQTLRQYIEKRLQLFEREEETMIVENVECNLLGHFSNEPSDNEEPNIKPDGFMTKPALEEWEAEPLFMTDVVIKFRSTKPINTGEELLWCYGDQYKRAYIPGKACMPQQERE